MRKAATPISIALAAFIAIGSLTGCSSNGKFDFLSFGKKQEVEKQTNREVLAYTLEDMDHRVADHTTPDAMVHIAPGYDRAQPIHLVVYNHGMMTNLNDVEKGWQLGKAMKDAAPNTVLIAPEWAVTPSNLSAEAGKFHEPGYFKGVLEEAFSKTPELKGRSLNDVKDIRLTSFSGGLYPLVSELEKNGIEDKVVSVTLFDSLYKGFALDPWLKKNITALASGQKQYQNFYFHTWPASLQQMKRVQKMLADAKVNHASTKFDTADAYTVMDPEKIASKGIVYKYSMAGIDENTIGHNAVPKTYIPVFLKAAGTMGPEGVRLANRTTVKVKRVM
jgi:hypothetical protein